MTLILPMMLAMLMVAGADAQAAEAAVPRASEALVERFIAVLPASAQGPANDRGPDPIQLDLLAEFNPGRIDEIRPILEAEAACTGPLRREMNGRMLRSVAAGLGDEKLGRLASFYEGEDYHLFDGLRLRREEAGTLSEREQNELDRLLAAYPIMEYAEAMRAAFPAMLEDPAMERLIQCGLDRAQAFERQGLRLFPDPADE